MTRFSLWMAFLTVCAATLTAHATPLPFAPGERLGMEVRYLGLKVGEFDISVTSDESNAQRPVWPLSLEGRTRGLFDSLYSVRENFVSHFDPVKRGSAGSHERSITGSDNTDEQIKLVAQKALVTRTLNGNTTQRVVDVEPDTHDILSAIYFLRTTDLEKDTRVSLPVFSGKKSWTLDARVVGKERIKGKLGTFDTWVVKCRTHLDGKLQSDREITIWLSDDERRLLVRVEADVAVGALKLNLVSYDAPPVKAAATAAR